MTVNKIKMSSNFLTGYKLVREYEDTHRQFVVGGESKVVPVMVQEYKATMTSHTNAIFNRLSKAFMKKVCGSIFINVEREGNTITFSRGVEIKEN